MLTSNAASQSQKLTIARLLGRWAGETPENIAIVAPGRSTLTYARLIAHIEESVGRLNEMGLGRNDRIAIVLPNGPEMAVAFLVAGSAATCAPLNPAYRASEFDFYLNDLNAKALIVQSGVESPARTAAHQRGIPIIELAPCAAAEAGLFTLTGNLSLPAKDSGFAAPDDVALVLHTSGTTARPKIVPLTHRNLCASARHIRETLALAPRDRCLNVMPLFHIHGLIGATLSSLAGGASVVCTPGFYAPKFFEWMEEFRPSWYTAVPTMHQAILARADTNREIIDRSPLRLIRSSSAALPPQVMAELERVFKAPVIESYGMTEASHQMASNPLPPRVRKPGSVGVAAGPEIAIMGEVGDLLPAQRNGEVVIRGPNVIAGYENNAVANASAFTTGWFRTGDQGYLDPDGYLFINGRLKEIINRGGEKISPREIDEVLLNHPAVAQAATFAIPHTKLGEEIGAAVVLREKSSATERELREFAAARLADFKVPYRILILDEIPKGPTGKMQRIGLAEKLGLQTINPELPVPRSEFTGPRDDCESALAKIWCEVLGQSQLSVHDNFLELGGDSILGAQILSRVRRSLRVELPLLVLFEEGSNVAGLAEAIQRVRHRAETSLAIGIVPDRRGHELPLSFGQERLWFLSQLEPGNPAYNRPAVMRLLGRLDVSTLERSLAEIIHRHESLRTTFPAKNGKSVQVIRPADPLRLGLIDLSAIPDVERDAEAARLASVEARTPFDLARGPLSRFTLLRLSEAEHLLLFTVHHIIFDGWSMDIFIRELTSLYAAFGAGKSTPLADLPIQYADYARWQRQSLEPALLERQLAYWKQQLVGAPQDLPLPADRPRPDRPTYNGRRQKVALPRSLTESLKNLSRNEGATLFMTLLAAWQTVLFRYTQQNDILIGTAVSGRNREETEPLIGHFVNLLVLRTDLSNDPPFRALLRRVREVALGAYANQDVPFEKLVGALRAERRSGRTPLFQVMFVLKRATPVAATFGDLTLTLEEIDYGLAAFDLALELWEGPEGLHGYFEYSTDLFESPTIARMVGHYLTLLDGIVANPDARLSQLTPLSKEELHRLHAEDNQTPVSFPQDRGVHELIEAQAERTPDALAVSSPDQDLSYQELQRRANQLAHYLQDLGVGPEITVGLCLERGPELLVGMLGILKAGGAYVPLDPVYPADRLAFMLSDSKAPILVTTQRCLPKLSGFGGRIVCLDGEDKIFQKSFDNPTSAVSPENVAYVIYTSGSTGSPKGVLITHRSLLNHCLAIAKHGDLKVGDRVLQFASLSFDVAAEEIFPSLVSGAAVVMDRHDKLAAVAGFSRYLGEAGITVANLPAAYWHEWVSELSRSGPQLPASLRLIIVGSDCVAPDKLAMWGKMGTERIRWCNAYGPTETTITATLYEPKGFDAARATRSVPIGSPIANVRVYVLDSSLAPVLPGVAGELCLAGEGLARGYLNQPALTAEKFIPDPFSHIPGARLYRTGDVARYLPDVCLEFLGRMDGQVKIRGFRIELGEIESVLAGHPAVREAVVLAREDAPGEKRLVAYVVSSPAQKLLIAELLSFLKQKLPDYMVPSVFFALEKLPRNLSGKINRKALPKPGQARPDLNECYTAARTPLEEKLAGIWERVLRLDRVGVHDDFFELGGHSLLVVQIISRVRDAFQIELPLRSLFDAPTVAALALTVSQYADEKNLPQGKSDD